MTSFASQAEESPTDGGDPPLPSEPYSIRASRPLYHPAMAAISIWGR